jgi:hypothetical protein
VTTYYVDAEGRLQVASSLDLPGGAVGYACTYVRVRVKG